VPEFDDAWYEDWTRWLEESGGNIILALGLRPIEESGSYRGGVRLCQSVFCW